MSGVEPNIGERTSSGTPPATGAGSEIRSGAADGRARAPRCARASATQPLPSSSAASEDGVLGSRGCQHGINLNDLPSWQKRGQDAAGTRTRSPARPPKTGELVSVVRRRLAVDRDLPLGDAYGRFIIELLETDGSDEYRPDRLGALPTMRSSSTWLMLRSCHPEAGGTHQGMDFRYHGLVSCALHDLIGLTASPLGHRGEARR